MFEKIGRAISRIEDLISSVTLAVGIGMIFVGVVQRYVLNAPSTIIDELSTAVIVWGIIVGFSVALRTESHVKMDFFYDIAKKESAKRAMRIFGDVVGLIYTVFIAIYGYRACAMQFRFGRVTPMTELPLWGIYAIIPVVGILMSIRYLMITGRELTSSEKNAEER